LDLTLSTELAPVVTYVDMNTAIHASPILAAVRAALAGDAGVELAIVFGSVARGDYRPDSDVDVAVLARPAIDLTEVSARIAARVGREVDVVVLNDAGVPLIDAILRDGVVVHEGRVGAGAMWWSRALMDREVDGPWYARMRDASLRRVAKEGVGHGQS
jgi:predicted nucleotidyltransferase